MTDNAQMRLNWHRVQRARLFAAFVWTVAVGAGFANADVFTNETYGSRKENGH